MCILKLITLDKCNICKWNYVLNLKLTVLFKCSIFKNFFVELLKDGLATLQLSLTRAQYDIFAAIGC